MTTAFTAAVAAQLYRRDTGTQECRCRTVTTAVPVNLYRSAGSWVRAGGDGLSCTSDVVVQTKHQM